MPRGQSPREAFSLGEDDDGVNVVVGERLGYQTPPEGHCFIPPYTNSLGDKAMWFLHQVGFNLDPWQEYVLRNMLNLDAQGHWAASEALLLVPRQNGKGMRCDAMQFTINRGWIRFGDIQVGDIIPHPSGGTTKVTFKSGVHHVDCYRVTTTDGRTEVFDGDHLWEVTDKCREHSNGRRERSFEKRIVNTRTMFREGVARSTRQDGHFEGRFQLPRQHALYGWDKQDLPIDPYLLGVWLGDGDSHGAALTCHQSDRPHMERAIREAGFVPTVHADPQRMGITSGFISLLRQLGVLGNKHVPDLYLTASELQREALLQGLMDTDGYCSPVGQVEFCSVKRELAESVLFLARSLGWRATITTGRAMCNGKDCGVKYRVCWHVAQTDRFSPFRMERKLSRIPVTASRARFVVSIRSIEPVASEPTVCIQVDADDELFVAGRDLLATHNTAIIEARELVGLYVIGDKTCIHTAVLFTSARESYYRLKARIENFPELQKITRFRSGNDNMSIEIKAKAESKHPNAGGRVVYMARGTAVARGFSADVIVLDEAYALDEASIAAIDYATSARRNPFIIYASSTGMEDSTELEKLHDRGMSHDPDMLFMEWCATSRDLDDEENYYRSNPALGFRISIHRVRKERKRHSDKTFGRERLGLWNDNSFNAVIPTDLWKSLCLCHGAVHEEHAVEGVPSMFEHIVSDTVVAVDSTPDGSFTTVSWAGYTADNHVQIEILQDGKGVGWAVDFVARLFSTEQTDNPPPLAVVVQAGATAGQLIPELEALGIEVVPFGQRDICDACKYFYDRANDGRLSHLGDFSLSSALGGATQIFVGKSGGTKEEPEYRTWYWGRRDVTVNITGLCSATYAAWGLNKVLAKRITEREPWENTEQGSWIW